MGDEEDLRELDPSDDSQPGGWCNSKFKIGLWTLVGVVILCGIAALVTNIYMSVTRGGQISANTPIPVDESYSPLILISSDGFRWDYPTRTSIPNIEWIFSSGTRPKSMKPSFPTKTFPNHYSIVTGLYPAHHGIIDNTMFDPVMNSWFHLYDAAAVRDARWWGGEPIWVTCERQHVKSGTYFWPGSEAAIGGVRPSYWLPYNGDTPYNNRVDTVLEWIDLPAAERPQLITLYMEAVDHAGHSYGPDAPEVVDAMHEIDAALGRLFAGLDQRRMRERTNIIFLADHGMTTLSDSRIIRLDDYISLADVTVITYYPVLNIIPKPGKENTVYNALVGAHPELSIYWNDTLPERWHFSDNPRIGRIVGVASLGWAIMNRNSRLNMVGTHGYDNADTDMHAIFAATGPAFQRNQTLHDTFENVNVYSIMARILGVTPAPTDGSLAAVKDLLVPELRN